MKTLSRVAALAICGFAIAGVLSITEPIRAQNASEEYGETESMAHAAKVLPGEYRKLNWHRKLRLGAATFVDPALVEKSAFAYAYDPRFVAEPEVWDMIQAYVEEGTVAVAEQTPEGHFNITPASADPVDVMIKMIEAKGGKAYLISPEKELLVGHKGSPLVSWETF